MQDNSIAPRRVVAYTCADYRRRTPSRARYARNPRTLADGRFSGRMAVARETCRVNEGAISVLWRCTHASGHLDTGKGRPQSSSTDILYLYVQSLAHPSYLFSTMNLIQLPPHPSLSAPPLPMYASALSPPSMQPIAPGLRP